MFSPPAPRDRVGTLLGTTIHSERQIREESLPIISRSSEHVLNSQRPLICSLLGILTLPGPQTKHQKKRYHNDRP